jgi:hypothetical protein
MGRKCNYPVRALIPELQKTGSGKKVVLKNN